jgi:hypothetical protein
MGPSQLSFHPLPRLLLCLPWIWDLRPSQSICVKRGRLYINTVHHYVTSRITLVEPSNRCLWLAEHIRGKLKNLKHSYTAGSWGSHSEKAHIQRPGEFLSGLETSHLWLWSHFRSKMTLQVGTKQKGYKTFCCEWVFPFKLWGKPVSALLQHCQMFLPSLGYFFS